MYYMILKHPADVTRLLLFDSKASVLMYIKRKFSVKEGWNVLSNFPHLTLERNRTRDSVSATVSIILIHGQLEVIAMGELEKGVAGGEVV